MADAPWRRILVATVALLAGCRRTAGPPFTPDEALKTFAIEEGFAIALVAAEPQIASPVAIDFDEDGRLFVVEMPGYPLDTRPTGRIRLLEDTDGDGRIDKSTVFADGLVLPTGVMRWKKGVLVTAAPDVWYLADEDGDGRADRRERILTGFAFSNPQHTVNSPVYGLDNWIWGMQGYNRSTLTVGGCDTTVTSRSACAVFPTRSALLVRLNSTSPTRTVNRSFSLSLRLMNFKLRKSISPVAVMLFISFQTYGTIALNVSLSVGAYISIAMCICIVISVGAAGNSLTICESLISCVPTRLPFMSSNMN
jgi:hypothetical protein